MSLVNLVFSPPINGFSIASLSLDVLLSEENTLNSEVTEYPVEHGSPIIDHISQQSETVSIAGVITSAKTTLFGESGKQKILDAKLLLKEIHAKQLPVSIVTDTEQYDDYAMTSCNISKEGSFEKINISASFKKIRFAETEEADIPPEKTSSKKSGGKGVSAKGKAGKTKANKGKAKTFEASPSSEKQIKKIKKEEQRTSSLKKSIGRIFR